MVFHEAWIYLIHKLLTWTGIVIVPATFIVGIYLTWRTRAYLFRHFLRGFSVLSRKSSGFSTFEAFASILGGNLGVGNISGIAVALSQGGPGTLVWMWVMALLSCSIKFVSCGLGVLFRTPSLDGGPMFFIKEGLGKPWLAKVFCVATLAAGLFVGNLAQVNSIALSLDQIVSPWVVVGILMATLTVIFYGGVSRFGKVSAFLVPAMAFFYVLGCAIILVQHSSELPEAFSMIFDHAFKREAIISGNAIGFFHVVRTGFSRGLFATDAGAGLEAILHASIPQDHQKKEDFARDQALASAIAPLIVVTLCTLTALVLLTTHVWQQPLESTCMCSEAFGQALGGAKARWFLALTVFLFGLTTILTWTFCCEKALQFLYGKKSAWCQWFCVCSIPIGALFTVESVWSLGDLAFSLMLIINMLSILSLSPRFTTILFRKSKH